MNKRCLTLLAAFCTSTSCFSFSCYFTLVKDSCWLNYDVTVDVTEFQKNKKVLEISVPKGKAWARQQFECQAGEQFAYTAHFSPVFWASDEGKIYSALHFWSLPTQINAGDSAWNISVCYPSDFSMVPMPPDASESCRCDFSSVPAIPPREV